MTDDAANWVGLSEAAKALGVHPATVRSWADRGHLPSQRTPGGHRRFRLADLAAWQEQQKAGPAAEAQLLVQSAIGRARLEIGEGQVAGAEWYRRLDKAAREDMSGLGRRLMDVLKRYLTSPSESALAEARELALRYGKTLRAQLLTLPQTVEGFFTFHDVVVDAMIDVIGMTRGGPVGSEWGEAMRKVYAFTREIMLALVDAYAEHGDQAE